MNDLLSNPDTGLYILGALCLLITFSLQQYYSRLMKNLETITNSHIEKQIIRTKELEIALEQLSQEINKSPSVLSDEDKNIVEQEVDKEEDNDKPYRIISGITLVPTHDSTSAKFKTEIYNFSINEVDGSKRRNAPKFIIKPKSIGFKYLGIERDLNFYEVIKAKLFNAKLKQHMDSLDRLKLHLDYTTAEGIYILRKSEDFKRIVQQYEDRVQELKKIVEVEKV